MEKRSFNFGFSTILISFVMMCIVTFCALSLLTANADYRLSKKAADRTSACYTAEENAYHTLSDIDRMLVECYDSSSSREDYFTKAAAAAEDYSKENSGVSADSGDGLILSWENEISDTAVLSVSITVTWPADNDRQCFTVNEWRTINETPAADTQTLDLIGKEI